MTCAVCAASSARPAQAAKVQNTSAAADAEPGAEQKSADSAKTLYQHALQIQTDADGYNSGRTYYLQAASDEQCAAISATLGGLAHSEREAAAARTRLARVQRTVLRAYESAPFQCGVAVLIIVVRRSATERAPQQCARRNRARRNRARAATERGPPSPSAGAQ